MGIGTSLGAYYKDEKEWAAAPYLNNPNSTPDKMEISPNEVMPAPEDDITLAKDESQGMEVGLKAQMPYPDNRNPETDFDNRFPKDLKPGILNDLKPPAPDKPLQRKSDSGEYDVAANLTNTPGEILEGLEGTRVFGAGIGVPGPTQMRRPANSNKKSGQIEDGEVYQGIVDDWNSKIDNHRRGNEILTEQSKLLQTLLERPWSDLEKHKFKKLDKEHESIFKPQGPFE